jgi:hypothetical protein
MQTHIKYLERSIFVIFLLNICDNISQLVNIFSFLLISCKVFKVQIYIFFFIVNKLILYQPYLKLLIKFYLFIQINFFFSYLLFVAKQHLKREVVLTFEIYLKVL